MSNLSVHVEMPRSTTCPGEKIGQRRRQKEVRGRVDILDPGGPH